MSTGAAGAPPAQPGLSGGSTCCRAGGLRYAPFRGDAAIARGRLTRSQLAGPTWRRMFRDIYRHVDATADALAWCQAANLLLPPGAALSHRSAALLHGVNLLPGPVRRPWR